MKSSSTPRDPQPPETTTLSEPRECTHLVSDGRNRKRSAQEPVCPESVRIAHALSTLRDVTDCRVEILGGGLIPCTASASTRDLTLYELLWTARDVTDCLEGVRSAHALSTALAWFTTRLAVSVAFSVEVH